MVKRERVEGKENRESREVGRRGWRERGGLCGGG